MSGTKAADPTAMASALEPAGERPMRADARRNYERLLREAAAAFAERGADDVSLEEIARRSCVGIGTLYRHFPTRQALLEAVYRDQVETLGRLAGELLRSESPGEALQEWLRALMAFGVTKRSMTRALLATVGKDSELLTSSRSIMSESVSQLLERAQEAGVARPEVLGPDLLRMVHGMMLACDYSPGDPDQPERMLSMVLAGLMPDAAPRPAG